MFVAMRRLNSSCTACRHFPGPVRPTEQVLTAGFTGHLYRPVNGHRNGAPNISSATPLARLFRFSAQNPDGNAVRCSLAGEWVESVGPDGGGRPSGGHRLETGGRP